MLVERVSPAADQPESRAVGHPLVNPCEPFLDAISYRFNDITQNPFVQKEELTSKG